MESKTLVKSGTAPRERAAHLTFPGFDAIRLLAAWAVVFSHCYPIAGGISKPDLLGTVFGDRQGFGGYAVQVFFILSGFLLSGSLDANPDPLRYLTNRIARIVPGFCFAIVVSVVLIAPLLSDLGWSLVISRAGWASIFWSITCLRDSTAFALSASRFPELNGFLNGSLWTIPYELVCYLVLLFLYMVLRKASRVAAAALVLSLVTIAGPRLGWTTIDWAAAAPGVLKLPMVMFDHTLPYFCGGAAFYAFHKRWGTPRFLVGVAAALLTISAFFHMHSVVLAFVGPVLLVAIGSRRNVFSWLTKKTGDVSYGVYLFGWPVGLLVAAKAETTNPLLVFALSIPLVFAFSYAMHRLVEVPVNDIVKPRVLQWLPRFSLTPGLRASPSNGASDALAKAVYALAYVFCVVAIGRFLIYPYAFSLNWFGFQVYQLLAITVILWLILKSGEVLSRYWKINPPREGNAEQCGELS